METTTAIQSSDFGHFGGLWLDPHMILVLAVEKRITISIKSNRLRLFPTVK